MTELSPRTMLTFEETLLSVLGLPGVPGVPGLPGVVGSFQSVALPGFKIPTMAIETEARLEQVLGESV